MKDNLMLEKYETESINGTFNLSEEKTFFNTKVMDIEDEVHIIDKSIQYFQVFTEVTTEEKINNGYQYNTLNLHEEELFIMDIVNVKHDNNKIFQVSQTEIENNFNTKWQIDINIKNILLEYLFAKVKKARTFNSLNYDNFANKNINKSILEYIKNNLLDRYEFESIDLFIKYIDIKNNVIYSNLPRKQFNPLFNQSIEVDEYRVSNANMELNLFLDKLSPIKIFYDQIESSLDFKFDYYFNVHYKKI